ncbi:MAG TPA: ABC transporter permease subunit, partial [Tianweitania sediminis]|nr:ABC transporter permease subunit [Tianweitania sediminis]
MSSHRISLFLWRIALIAALLAAWQISATLWPAPYLPKLQAVFLRFLAFFHGNLLVSAVLPSLYRFAIGFGLAVFLGSLVGLTLGYIRNLNDWVRPILEYLRFLPTVALLPAALLLFGATDGMRIFVIAFGSIFPVILAAMDGARRVDQVLIDVARVNGLTISERIFRVILPASLPAIFAGIRIALAIALVMMVISELIASNNGVGHFILRSQRLFQTANVYAGVLLLGGIGLVLTSCLLAIEARVLGW